MLVYQQAWRDGTMSLFDLWEPESTHHGLLAPMLLWANVSFFGLDARLANYVTGWVIASICVIVASTSSPIAATRRRRLPCRAPFRA